MKIGGDAPFATDLILTTDHVLNLISCVGLFKAEKRRKVQFDVYADGSPALQPAPGVFRKIKPLSLRFCRHKRDEKLVPYGRYMITAEIDCDPRLHGYVFDIRLDKSASGVPLGEYL